MEQITTTQHPRIAILMATYNGERFLAEQIGSILDQTNHDWHLYIHDDGSTDHTPDLIRTFARQHLRLNFLKAINAVKALKVGRDGAFRIADRHGTILRQRHLQHRLEFVRILRLQDREVRQATQHRDVEHAVVRTAIRAHAADMVDRKDDRQLQQAHVVHHLVDGPLEKRRIHGDDRPTAGLGETGGKRDEQAFANAHIEETLRKFLRKRRQPRAIAHRRRERAHARILPGLFA